MEGTYRLIRRLFMLFLSLMITTISSAQWTTGKIVGTNAWDSTYVPIFKPGYGYHISVYNLSTQWLQFAVGNDTTQIAGAVWVPPQATVNFARPTKSRIGPPKDYTFIRARFETAAGGDYVVLIQFMAELRPY